MASDAEIDKTLKRGENIDSMWKQIEEKLQQYERDKEEFAREFGFTYEKYLEYMSNQASQARETAGSETLAELEQRTASFKQEFEDDLAQAKARHEAEQQLEKTSGKRPRRMRDMI